MNNAYKPERRFITDTNALPSEEDLGPLGLLRGTWRTPGWDEDDCKKTSVKKRPHATGWNMIALPFQEAQFKYRILMNQNCEELRFGPFVDENVPNRGLTGVIRDGSAADQFIYAIDYVQHIHQVAVEDFPDSAELDSDADLAGAPGRVIHHEPGQWLYMKDPTTETETTTIDKGVAIIDGNLEVVNKKLEVARLASIPHGNSVLALGTYEKVEGKKAKPVFPRVSGLPIGRFEEIEDHGRDEYDVYEDAYLEPYKYFIENLFRGTNPSLPPGTDPFPLGDEFPGFDPRDMTKILAWENRDFEIEETTILTVDSTRQNAGIANIPFVVKQADPVSMKSTFWIQKLKPEKPLGPKPLRRAKWRLQYVQVVMMDFFRPREDGHPGRARWPHVSINTLEKVSDF